MPKFYMLIGVPGSGKSTWIKQHKQGTAVASSDEYIEQQASKSGKTYNDVFDLHIKAANLYAKKIASDAIDIRADLIWDQTNLTKKSRRPKLDMIPDDYEKIAVYFPTPHPDIHRKRLDSRPGKSIPNFVLDSMIKSIQPPGKDEGFDDIIIV